MAEKIVSPGVFTKEKDLSFLPQGVGEIGAVIIGTTAKGPAFVPTVIESFADFEQTFGSTDPNYYVPYTVQSYLKSAGKVTVVRCLGLDGYTVAKSAILYNNNSKEVVAVLAPSALNAGGDLTMSALSPTNPAATGSFSITISGSSVAATSFSCSLNTSADNHIEKIFGTNPQSQLKSAYCFKLFNDAGYYPYTVGTASMSTSSLALETDTESVIDFGSTEYSQATTPTILSQNSDSLFSIKTISHGNDMNTTIKVSIYNVKKAGSIAGSDYGAFSIAVRKYDDTDKKQEVLESFQNINLDPNSSNFILKQIGDRYLKSIDNDGKITWGGNYSNKSKYIYISPASYDTIESFPKDLVPYGHSAYKNPVSASGTNFLPNPSFKSDQKIDSVYNSKAHYGLNLDDLKVNSLNYQFTSPIPAGGGTHASGAFSLNEVSGTSGAPAGYNPGTGSTSLLTLANSHVNQRKFTVGFQEGFDGFNPARKMYTGENISDGNLFGFDFSGADKEGQKAWKKALNSVSNPDEFDVNLIITPGIVQGVHDSIVTHTINICEDRGDCFYLMDCTILGKTITAATSAVSTLDTNYAATYWPWVKIIDTTLSKPVWVPPSVVLGGVIAYTDKVSHEWFAPAGLNRGGLAEVVEAETRLTHAERDDLYEERVNPIASFPGQGVVVWGQKTFQGKPSALDRVNVRRLLIKVKKFIASASRYLVFEQNTAATRQRFLNIANPFLESVQANSGLSAFKVVMDESNNTPDLIDRNILYGQIFVQPTRTAEFIVLDFSILPTGAAFPE
tara:strand:+ start:3769 stop:6132 length:2364 start_codon:yes stop_codon:yes gene_type:complete